MNFTVESDIGLKRTINEDRAAFFERPDHFKLAVLADGMGGHNAGDVASEMAITKLKTLFFEAENEVLASEAQQWLKNSAAILNENIYHYSLTTEGCNGMGTTLIAVLIDDAQCTIVHIGDSRVYYFAENDAKLITSDHSFVNALLENGQISEEEAQNHPNKNFILKALGTEKRVAPDFYEVTLGLNSYLLVCSDGLSNKMTSSQMAAIIYDEQLSLEEKGRQLIQLANDNGGEDNISIVLISMEGEV